MPKRQRSDSLKELSQSEDPLHKGDKSTRVTKKLSQKPQGAAKTESIAHNNSQTESCKTLLEPIKPDASQKSLFAKLMKSGSCQRNFTAADLLYENPLDRKYFRQQVVQLAQTLLGKVMVRETEEGIIKAVIVQTEAYKAPLDKACHAFNNKKTERTKYFWLDGGHLYIYTIYMPTNVCLNVVAGLEGEPEAVLIRAVQPIVGIDLIKKMRALKSSKTEDLCNGPGKVGQSLAVDKDSMNGIDLTQGPLRIVDGGIKDFQMGISRRVNIDNAEEWVHTPWRFFIKGNTFVSKVKFEQPKPSKKEQKKASDS